MNNKTLAILLLVILAIALLILILSCELSKSKRKKSSFGQCVSCKKKKDTSGTCSTCEASIVSLNSLTADNVYVDEGSLNQEMPVTFADQVNAYNTLNGNNNFTYNPFTRTLTVDFVNAVFNGTLQLGNDGIVYQKDNQLGATPFTNQNNGQVLTVQNGSLVWKNPSDLFIGGGGGGVVTDLSKGDQKGILYQNGPTDTQVLPYEGNNKILWVAPDGNLRWVSPVDILELRGATGPTGATGPRGNDMVLKEIPVLLVPLALKVLKVLLVMLRINLLLHINITILVMEYHPQVILHLTLMIL